MNKWVLKQSLQIISVLQRCNELLYLQNIYNTLAFTSQKHFPSWQSSFLFSENNWFQFHHHSTPQLQLHNAQSNPA